MRCKCHNSFNAAQQIRFYQEQIANDIRMQFYANSSDIREWKKKRDRFELMLNLDWSKVTFPKMEKCLYKKMYIYVNICIDEQVECNCTGANLSATLNGMRA